jgi:probable F420-dependent oxidoreductase
MRFLVNLPNCMHVPAVTQPWEHDLSGVDIARVAREADELGFWGVTLPEHFFTPTAHLELSGDHYFHATTAQGFVAGATSTIRVGSLVSILPLHHPLVTAKAMATLDWLSGGRAFFTFGVGWLKEEFDALRVPFERRGRLADEYLAAILELLHNDRPSFKGETVEFDDIAFGPLPIQRPHPPMWLGGDADAVVRRAARFADGWAPWLTPPDALPAKLDLLRSQPEWDDRPFDVFYSLAALNIGAEHAITDDPDAIAKTEAQEVIDSCGRLAEQGVTHTWVAPPAVGGLEAYLDHVRWVAAEIVPACAD